MSTVRISESQIVLTQVSFVVFLSTYSLTYSMERSPASEANRISASQEISRILWNRKVHYHIQKYPPVNFPYPEPPRFSPNPTSYFLKIRLNIILPSTPGFSKRSFSPRKLPYTTLLSLIHATCPSHIILQDLITRRILGE